MTASVQGEAVIPVQVCHLCQQVGGMLLPGVGGVALLLGWLKAVPECDVEAVP